MEGLVGLDDLPVLITGHTGFKGSWLSLWLAALGARVHGFALGPPTQPNLFEVARIREVLASDTRADLGDRDALGAAIARAQPVVVFHLAAQALVVESYRDPVGTFRTNVLGTAALLDAIRQGDSVRAVVVVATDKVYENNESGQAFREGDPLGGHDPYSASKAAAEIVTSSFRTSFFGDAGHAARIATARAGNVIGGGDWANDRLVPDCLRAFSAGAAVRLRHPDAVRPWQHVLGPLSGYLILAARLLEHDGGHLAHAWNFGPDAGDDATVGDVARRLGMLWGPDAKMEPAPAQDWHEAGLLRLDSTMARSALGWAPRWSVDEALRQTVAWHRAWLRGDDMQSVSRRQIEAYAAASST